MTSDPVHRRSDWLACALDQFEARLLHYAQRIVGDRDEARDIVQDTFLKLCRQNPAELNGKLAQWLYAVCRNRALDVRRRRSRAPSTTNGEWPESTPPLSREPLPATAAAEKEIHSELREELSRLTSRQQECIQLKFQHALSYREISAITGLNVSNVGFLIHTGLKAVRRRMTRSASRSD